MLRIMVGSLLVTFMLSLPSLHAETGSDPAGQDPWTLEEIVTAIADEPHLVLGVLDGPDCEVFGRITDAAIDADGRVFVLDAVSYAVIAFDREGECLFRVGRRGQGPGEFSSPERVAVTDEGVLFVLDSGNGRIERFDVSGDGVERLSSIPLRVRASNFCHLGGRLFVAAMVEDPTIREIDDEGVARASFGSLVESSDPTARLIGSPEVMLCHQTTRSIVVAARHLPVVHRYTSDGVRAFAGELPGFVPAVLVEREGRIIGYGRSPEGIHYGVSAIELAASAVLLQSGGRVDGGMFMGVNSALLDVEAGALRPVDHRLPHVFAARGRWLLAAHHDEFPRVGVWTRPDERAW